ncbi:DUF5134 domain-containing protein [Streptomyces sp. AJS327]|uniref:DUF5134 domain-containing protein n=1 Tax=Streptomyces sp. AJS327 TaxID=2545265 RepID=UPI0015DF6791|nr:DUF5134 domain-containing protein [Streptomyces sp. AJS327]MBA0052539.1 DUF5134 domain-containing protein [Streptomyces sp. AJS327]
MHGPPMVGWLLVAVSALGGAVCLLRVAPGAGARRWGALSEAVMGGGMAAMALPVAPGPLSPPLCVGLFTTSALGECALALHAARRGDGPRGGPRGSARHGGDRVAETRPVAHHLRLAGGALAMVYMAWAMGSAHQAPGTGPPGVPVVTWALVLCLVLPLPGQAHRMLPGSGPPVAARGEAPELAAASHLAMTTAMVAMLLTL